MDLTKNFKLKIGTTDLCHNKDRHPPGKGWTRYNAPLSWLMKHVNKGGCWVGTHFRDEERTKIKAMANGSNIVVFDIDGDTTLDRWWQLEFTKKHCLATYTSTSHTEDEHRFRAIFPLACDTESNGRHKGVYTYIREQLLAELELDALKDPSGSTIERAWYGNTNAEWHTNAECEPIPKTIIDAVAVSEEYEEWDGVISQTDIEKAIYVLKNILPGAQEKNDYDTYFMPVTAAARNISSSEEMREAWEDWLERGGKAGRADCTGLFDKPIPHRHDMPPHVRLFSLTKEKVDNWHELLPAHLQSSRGMAAGYGEVDPIALDSAPDSAPKANDKPKAKTKRMKTQVTPDANKPQGKSNPYADERKDHVACIKHCLKDLRQNELTDQIEYTDADGSAVVMQGNDLDLLTTKLAVERGIFIREETMKRAVKYAAKQNRYCPIKRYLECCKRTEKPHPDWAQVGEVFLGNDNPLATQAMQRLLIGAVARAYNPGTQMSWLPILVGPQGAGKSMFARSLVPEDLFGEISTPLDTLMREMYRMHVAWVLELPEIDAYFSPKNIENFKNMVSTRVDEVRRPYAELPSRLKRRFVLIGTTNRSQFLVDSTGNRRFVPLEIGKNFLVPWEKLQAERDALWAAAIDAYEKGVTHEFTSGEVAEMSEYINEFGDPDPWSDQIIDYIKTEKEVRVVDILTKGLNLDSQRQGRLEARRVADVLQAQGWRRHVTSRKDPITDQQKSVRLWLRPIDDPIPHDNVDC